jgi:hypothetical protein
MSRDIPTHPYADDGTHDHRGDGRCVHCGLPPGNEHHGLPDRTTEMDEHRRRAGESETA